MTNQKKTDADDTDRREGLLARIRFATNGERTWHKNDTDEQALERMFGANWKERIEALK